MKNGASLTFHHISCHTFRASPLLAALLQQFQFISLLCLLHTHTRLHKQLGFNLQQVPQTVEKKKKVIQISAKAKLEMSKVEYIQVPRHT